MTGIGVLAGALPAPEARAYPSRQDAPVGRMPSPAAPPPNAQPASYLFHDECDGPAGSPPDPSKWTVAPARELIKNPVFWDRPENMGQYRDDRRNVFLDGNSNLVIRATKEGGKYFGGKIRSTWWGGIGHTSEAALRQQRVVGGAPHHAGNRKKNPPPPCGVFLPFVGLVKSPSCRRRRSR